MSEHLAFNTAASFVTNTNWQSYGGETHAFLFQPDGRADRAELRLRRDRHRGRRSAGARLLPRQGDARSAISGSISPAPRSTCCCRSRSSWRSRLIALGMPQNLSAYVDATTLEGAKQTLAQGPGRQPDRHQAARHQWRRLLQRQLRASLREPEHLDQHDPALGDPRHLARPRRHLRPHDRQGAARAGRCSP